MGGIPGLPRLRDRLLQVVLVIGAGLATFGAVGCGEAGSDKTVTVTKTETAETDKPDSKGSAAASTSAIRLVDYTGSLFTARVPSGWSLEKDEASRGDFVRSQWRHPSDPNTSILIDAVENETESPAEKAQQVRDATSATGGYQEVSFSPTTLQGADAYRWVFAVSGDKRADYFTNECGIGIAVLGSSSPSNYGRYAGLFRRVANSVETDCHPPPPDTPDNPPPSGQDESCEPGYDPCVPPYSEGDVDCADVGGPVSVTGDDPHGLDADGDGVGCE